jgi:bifunctional non-homologous end joining protein LigD
MALESYRSKPDFHRSPEPRGRAGSGDGASFVVQKHAARSLHFDFRLELDGVLRSWAVPRGPSLDPAERRLAVRVEDHPVAYGAFEGVIPEGQYGGGSVMLWDTGDWTPQGDPHEGLRRGQLKFLLNGRRLRGGWRLVRLDPPAAHGRENWLLIKERDEEARPGSGSALTEDVDRSVVSGRTMHEIARDRDRTWQSDAGDRKAIGTAAAAKRSGRARVPGTTRGRRARLPARPPTPQLATLVKEAPPGSDWLHEIKFDGYRILGRSAEGSARLLTRNGKDWTARYPAIAAAIATLAPRRPCLLDGELVVVRPDGTTSFQDLQQGAAADTGELAYYVFDLLHLDDRDLRSLPLLERKDLLAGLIGDGASGLIRFSDHVVGEGPAFFRRACELGLEGIISKRAGSVYRGGRSRDWVKVKCARREAFVVGGFTQPGGARAGFGSLLLGAYDDDGALHYHGKVGTGFSARTLRQLRAHLDSLRRATSPFSPPPPRRDARGATWVAPRLVVDVGFTELTRGGILRHPVFHGVRDDLKPADATLLPDALRAEAAPTPQPAGAAGTAARRGGSRRAGPSRPAPAAARPRGAAKDEAVTLAGERLTSPGKVLYPEIGITKRDLALYYEAVAGVMLPLIARRPLTLVRCPDGREGTCFYQKRGRDVVSRAVRRITVRDDGAEEPYLHVDSLSGLVALVQMGVLEIHTWNSRTDRLDRPDQLVFDLDPGPGVPWDHVVETALRLRIRLQELALESFVKTTGGKGLHVLVPVTRRHGWEEAKAFSKAVAEALVRETPERLTARMAKNRRSGRIFIDYLRNARESTAVAAYSTRAREGAPVSVPVTWEELAALRRGPDDLDVRTLPDYLASRARDPWAGFRALRQSITTAAREQLGLP